MNNNVSRPNQGIYNKEIRALVGIIIASWIMSFTMAFYWWAENRDAEIEHTRVRLLRLITIKDFVTETQSAFQQQVHQWKNLLIRYDRPDQYAYHLAAFHQYQEETQHLLMGCSTMASDEKLDDAPVLSALMREHQQLDDRYNQALKWIDPLHPASIHRVDQRVYGTDRHFLNTLNTVADHIDGYANLQITQLGKLNKTGHIWWGSYGLALLALQVIALISFARLIKVNQLSDQQDKRAAVIFESIGDAVIVIDHRSRIEFLNNPAEQLLGSTINEIKGKLFEEVFPIFNEISGKPAHNPVNQVMKEKGIVKLENHTLLRNREGKLIPIEDSAAPIFTDSGALDGVVLVFHDMTHHHELMRQLRNEHSRFRTVFEQTGIGMAFCEPHTSRIFEANQRMALILGFDDPRELIDQNLCDFYADTKSIPRPSLSNEPGGHANTTQESDILLESKSGVQRWYRQVSAYLGTQKDHIQDQWVFTFWDINDRVELQSKLVAQSIHDELTGLGNRQFFRETVSTTVGEAALTGENLAILLIDLDNFKEINDSKGHFSGDILLGEVARRLTSAVDEGSFVARLGGDEFVILLRGEKARTAKKSAEEICRSLSAPFFLEESMLFITASCGISLYPDHGLEHHTLLRRADLAMYSGKMSGKNRQILFDTKMETVHVEEQRLLQEMKMALNRHEFELYFQPKVALSNLKADSAEALIRWNHPTRGLLGPIEFIPLAERTGLIIQIGQWVIHETCRHLQAWQQSGRSELQLSFNASPRQLLEGEVFLHQLSGALTKYGISPQCLTMEITETALMDETSMATTIKVSELGVSLSLDDFGTGYSSLSLLQKLPLSSLKIDKSFVSGFLVNQTDDTLVQAIIGLGVDLGLNVVAEGIETSEQAAVLARYGCEYGQGYYFSKPLTEAHFIAYRDKNRTPGTVTVI